MGIFNDTVRGTKLVMKVLGNRRVRKQVRRTLKRRDPLEAGRYTIGVYFADGPVNLYQLRQWYAPLQELAKTHPVLIIARNLRTARVLLEECPLPVVYKHKVTSIERLLKSQPLKLIFYVNQNTRNFQMFRYGERWHVFINHGESDKMYMTTNQFKAYDFALIAGDAARARLAAALWDYDLDKRTIAIGRPQADHFDSESPYPQDGRTVVLYAPTWEGDRPGAEYGSVASHGVALVRALLQGDRHRVIYRPHPRTGVINAGYRAAHKQIVALLEQANRADPTAHHVYDTSSQLSWQLAQSDVAILDISAMIYDRLAVAKPLFVTRPVSESAQIDTGGYLSECEWLSAEDAGDIVAKLSAARDDAQLASRLTKWSKHYFGDTTPGAATGRFQAAVDRLLEQWDTQAAAHNFEG